MTDSPLIWSDGTRLDRVLRRLFGRIGLAFSGNTKASPILTEADFLEAQKVKASAVTVELPRAGAFFDTYPASSISTEDLRKILENDKTRISPVENSTTTVIAQTNASSGQLDLLHIHKGRLEAIEAQAAKLGLFSIALTAEDAPEISLHAPRTISRALRDRRLNLIALTSLIIGTWALLASLNVRLDDQVTNLSAYESLLRTQLLDRRERERNIGALGELTALEPQARTPQGILTQLEMLTTATPTTTWWTELEIEDGEVRLVAQSRNAGETLYGLTLALPSYGVQFSSAVTYVDDEKQAFTLQIIPKQGTSNE